MARLQAEINDTQFKQVQDLRKVAGMNATQKDVVMNGLTLLAWAVHKKSQGYSIAAIAADGTRVEFETPFLEAVALQSTAQPA